jgi:hypothetical protein
MNLSQFSNSVNVKQFMLGQEQKEKDFPVMRNLTFHILFASEQAIKVQAGEYIKSLLDNESYDKRSVDFNERFYEVVVPYFNDYLKE